MSIQEQPVHYDIPDQIPSSSTVINPGEEEYDPFTNEDDDDGHENEQLTDIKHQKQESIRINNGTTIHPVINNMNTSSSSDKSSSLETNEQQQSSRKSKSPVEDHNKYSDRRSKSPDHNHYSSDRKRLRPSSPDSFTATTTVNNNESLKKEIISSSKHTKSYRNDYEKQSKHDRSSSVSSSSNNNNKKSSDSKDEKSFNSSDSRRSSKRDDCHSHRHNSAHNYHSSSSSKYSSRDNPSSTHQSHIDRRTANSNLSSPSRIPSTIIPSDGNLSVHNNQSDDRKTSKEDRNKIYNRLKNVNDNNTSSIIPANDLNKAVSSESAFINSNGRSQHSRSNLIQIVTTQAAPILTQVFPVHLSTSQTKPEPIKPISVLSVPTNIESTTNTNDSSKSTTTTAKTNGGTADDMLMEDMLLEEEQEQSPVKSIDLDSLTIPEASTKKPDNKDESIKVIPTTSIATTTTTISTTTTTSASSLTPSPTKKPYTLYKVPHTNHMTPPLSSRHKKQAKKESSITQSDTPTNKSSTDDNLRRTSLDERISTLLGAPPISSTPVTNSSTEQQLDTRPNPPIQTTTTTTTTTSTPSDKSTESPQDIKSLILTMVKKDRDHATLIEQLNINEERRSATSKHYTTEWLASQKPEEAPPTEELAALPSLVTLPTLISNQPSTNNSKVPISNTGEVTMIGKLSEALSKLIQKQGDTNIPTTTETDDAVPISAKHLERIERRKQREKRQSEIAAIAKEALKPAFKKRTITKDEYKEIMKKVVTKATHANEVDRVRIRKMIDAYVEKYRSIRQHNTSKISTTSKVNGS